MLVDEQQQQQQNKNQQQQQQPLMCHQKQQQMMDNANDGSTNSSSSNKNSVPMIRLASLKSVASARGTEAEAQLLLQKLRQCQQHMPWTTTADNAEFAQALEVKAEALREVLDWLGSSPVARQLLNVDVWLQEELLTIVHENLFRPLPPNKQIAHTQQQQEAAGVVDPEEIANGGGSFGGGAGCLAPEWPHLQLVYRLLLHLIERIDLNESQGLHQHIDGSFVGQSMGEILDFVREYGRNVKKATKRIQKEQRSICNGNGHILARFHSTDPREREQLKAVLHGLYSRMVPLRAEIRKRMGWLLLGHVYERQQPWMGLPELMEILGNIVNGFNVPLKAEHRDFFLRVLMPLHKSHHGYIACFAQLTYCVAVFLEKDPTLAVSAVRTLLSNWPRQCSAKEVLFLVELEELLVRIDPSEFHAICIPLFRQLAKSVASQHCRVAERALHLWNNEHMLALVGGEGGNSRRENNNSNSNGINGSSSSIRMLMPIMFHALYTASEGHWNDTIAALVFKTLKRLMTLEPVLFDELVMNHEKQQMKQRNHHIEHERRWQRLNEAAMEEEEKKQQNGKREIMAEGRVAIEQQQQLVEMAPQIDGQQQREGKKNAERVEAAKGAEEEEKENCGTDGISIMSSNSTKSAPDLKKLEGSLLAAPEMIATMKDPERDADVKKMTKAVPQQIRRKHESGDATGKCIVVGEPRRKSSPSNGQIGVAGYGGSGDSAYRRSSSSECNDLLRLRRASSAIAAYHYQQQQQRQQQQQKEQNKQNQLLFTQPQHIR